jgi:hypothetical protein
MIAGVEAPILIKAAALFRSKPYKVAITPPAQIIKAVITQYPALLA